MDVLLFNFVAWPQRSFYAINGIELQVWLKVLVQGSSAYKVVQLKQ